MAYHDKWRKEASQCSFTSVLPIPIIETFVIVVNPIEGQSIYCVVKLVLFTFQLFIFVYSRNFPITLRETVGMNVATTAINGQKVSLTACYS